jgi:hypothetical protein
MFRMVQSFYKIKACLTALIEHVSLHDNTRLMPIIRKEYFLMTNLNEETNVGSRIEKEIRDFLIRDEKKKLYNPNDKLGVRKQFVKSVKKSLKNMRTSRKVGIVS